MAVLHLHWKVLHNPVVPDEVFKCVDKERPKPAALEGEESGSHGQVEETVSEGVWEGGDSE